MLRKRIIPVLLFCFLTSAGCSHHLPPGEHNNFHPYAVRHAILHFEYFGDIRGTEDLIVDSFGAREVHIVHFEIASEKGFIPRINYIVRTGADLDVVDSVRRVEVKLIDRPLDSLEHLLPGNIPTVEEAFRNNFVPPGYSAAGDTTVLGLKAHVWTNPHIPSYLIEWSGILIGKGDEVGGRVHELRLMSIDTTTPVDPARFIPPSGFPIRDLTKPGAGESAPPMSP